MIKQFANQAVATKFEDTVMNVLRDRYIVEGTGEEITGQSVSYAHTEVRGAVKNVGNAADFEDTLKSRGFRIVEARSARRRGRITRVITL